MRAGVFLRHILEVESLGFRICSHSTYKIMPKSFKNCLNNFQSLQQCIRVSTDLQLSIFGIVRLPNICHSNEYKTSTSLCSYFAFP